MEGASELLTIFNQNAYLAAFSILMMNLGSRYLLLDITKTQEYMLKSKIIRRITVFCMFYVATRDIIISLTLTLLFIVFNMSFLHEESKFCVVPKSLRRTQISKDEYTQAKKVVDLYEEQLKKETDGKNQSV
jgi:hypothetical protein